MPDHDQASLDLLNIYEFNEPEGPRFLICFLEPVLAGARGIDSRAVVGDFQPKPDGEFDPATFRLNGEFVGAFTEYMNEQGIESPELQAQARANPGSELYLVDPRHQDLDRDPAPGDLLGSFDIDEAGRPIAGSFRYNAHHVMFDPQTGPSHVLLDRRFYDWLHPVAREGA